MLLVHSWRFEQKKYSHAYCNNKLIIKVDIVSECRMAVSAKGFLSTARVVIFHVGIAFVRLLFLLLLLLFLFLFVGVLRGRGLALAAISRRRIRVIGGTFAVGNAITNDGLSNNWSIVIIIVIAVTNIITILYCGGVVGVVR